VDYDFRISKHAVTNAQYAEFLNSVAQTDPNALYDSSMASGALGGITRSGSSGSFTYAVKPGRSNNPVIYVSFFDAMRFANWLDNGQPSGDQNAGTTEESVYTIGTGANETRNPAARFFIPSEHEWYKSAYHKNDGLTGNYWNFPTATDVQPYSDQPPGGGAPDPSNTANYTNNDGTANGYNDGFAVSGTTVFSASQNYLSNVGAYSQSTSPYGTYDQGGDVWEWTEGLVRSRFRVYRGGSWNEPAARLASSFRAADVPTQAANQIGFRIASIAGPQPLYGDYNSDGIVDAGDYTVWRDNLGAPAGVLPNDSDSGVIGQAQYNTWKLNFGQVSGSSGRAAINRFVPDPSSVSLLMGAAALLAATRAQRVSTPLPWRSPGDA
jgi:formylglycine-generating enzyme required for sulfatase activity